MHRLSWPAKKPMQKKAAMKQTTAIAMVGSNLAPLAISGEVAESLDPFVAGELKDVNRLLAILVCYILASSEPES